MRKFGEFYKPLGKWQTVALLNLIGSTDGSGETEPPMICWSINRSSKFWYSGFSPRNRLWATGWQKRVPELQSLDLWLLRSLMAQGKSKWASDSGKQCDKERGQAQRQDRCPNVYRQVGRGGRVGEETGQPQMDPGTHHKRETHWDPKDWIHAEETKPVTQGSHTNNNKSLWLFALKAVLFCFGLEEVFEREGGKDLNVWSRDLSFLKNLFNRVYNEGENHVLPQKRRQYFTAVNTVNDPPKPNANPLHT